MRDMIRGAWAQILLALTVGILLLSYKEEWRYAALSHHLGTAFVIAAIVTAFWHLREVSEVIHKYVKAILFDYTYLTRLRLESLMELRSKAAKAILQKAADNPAYKRDELEDWLDTLLYDRLIPGKAPSSGWYRENYVEQIVIEYLTLQEARECEGLPTVDIPSTDLQSMIVRVTTTTDFTVIAPNVADEKLKYPVRFTGEGCGLPNFPIDKLIRASGGRDQLTSSPLAIKPTSAKRGQFCWEAGPSDLTFEKGKCRVWTEMVEYKSPLRESFILNTMALLTHNLTVSIHQIGKGPAQVFVGQLIATPANDMRGQDTATYRASLRYDGWLFEDHGYHFHWFPAVEELSSHELECKPQQHAGEPVIAAQPAPGDQHLHQ